MTIKQPHRNFRGDERTGNMVLTFRGIFCGI